MSNNSYNSLTKTVLQPSVTRLLNCIILDFPSHPPTLHLLKFRSEIRQQVTRHLIPPHIMRDCVNFSRFDVLYSKKVYYIGILHCSDAHLLQQFKAWFCFCVYFIFVFLSISCYFVFNCVSILSSGVIVSSCYWQ